VTFGKLFEEPVVGLERTIGSPHNLLVVRHDEDGRSLR
jgi:hypothetical protein